MVNINSSHMSIADLAEHQQRTKRRQHQEHEYRVHNLISASIDEKSRSFF